MKSTFFTGALALLTLALPAGANDTTALAERLVDAAEARTKVFVQYDPAYVSLDYPMGDVPDNKGVCTDVVIRAYRLAFGYDLQKAVHEDMRANFGLYPKIWGASRPDKNIDHRRVPNLEVFFARHGESLGKTKDISKFQPGDIVTWRLGNRVAHIGIVSENKNGWGVPMVIHNVGAGTVEESVLEGYSDWITGHYRFLPTDGN